MVSVMNPKRRSKMGNNNKHQDDSSWNKAHGRRDGNPPEKTDSGVGKNDKHGDSESHSQNHKSSGSKEGGSGN
jgi:hypothetical protein